MERTSYSGSDLEFPGTQEVSALKVALMSAFTPILSMMKTTTEWMKVTQVIMYVAIIMVSSTLQLLKTTPRQVKIGSSAHMQQLS